MMLLNLVLLALVAALAWMLRNDWLAGGAKQRAFLERQVQARKIEPPPAVPPVKPFAAAQYFEVADKSLFSRDRNSVIKEEPPPPPPPPPAVPELPSYHGQMNFGHPVVVLSTAKLAQHSYQAGETVGDFKVVRFDQEKIAFDFKGQTVERKLSDLRPKETVAQAQTGAMTPPPPPAAANAPSALTPAKPRIASLGGNTDGDDKKNTSEDSILGPELGGGDRACVEGDTLPTGATHSGYRKVSMISLLGQLCHWEKQK
jgi:hypothetical protein